MNGSIHRFGIGVVMTSAMGLVLAGCGLSGPLPSEVEVTLPDTSTAPATIGTGPESLAGTVWAMFRTADDRLLTRVKFNDQGGVAELFDNVAVGAEVFGASIVADGATHATATDGITYTAGSFGAENDSGFSFQLRAVAFFSGLQVGTGVASATGTHDNERMEGTFRFATEVTGLAASILPPEATTNDEFEFYALREDG